MWLCVSDMEESLPYGMRFLAGSGRLRGVARCG